VLVRSRFILPVFVLCAGSLAAQTQASDEPDALLERIRDKVKEYVSKLPNYTCHEVIERFGRSTASATLNHLDTVELEVAFVGNRELFARTPDDRFEEQSITRVISSGTIGNGSFGAHAAAVFTGSAATFQYVGPSKKEGHKTFRFDFVVPQEKSQFLVRHQPSEGIVGYKGSFWVDSETLDLVRLELKADHIPSYIGVSLIEEIMQYKPVRIRDADFLLPYKSELAAAERSGYYYVNTIKLERCKEFTGESVVTFGTPTDAPSAERAAPNQ
jgi:hypothetical protein